MKLRIVGGYGGELPGARANSFLVDDSLAVDAGSLSSGLSVEEQARIRHILLSHSHADHCASLPYFTENVFDRIQEPVQIHGIPPVTEAIRAHLMNGVLWPDMFALGVLGLRPMELGTPHRVGRYVVTPVEVPHTVPCTGFHVDDGARAILYTSDMGPNDTIWRFANRVERLDGLLVECSFPDRLGDLARVSQHMTPSLLAEGISRLTRDVRILVCSSKPLYADEIAEAVEGLGDPRLEVVQQDRLYTF